MTSAREVAVNTVMQVFENKAYSNIALNRNLNESNLIDKDKGLATELVYGTIKYKYSIDKILKTFLDKKFDKTDKYVLNLLRVCIYQLRYLDKIPEFAAVNEGVNLAKKHVSVGASKLVNGVLRNYLRDRDKKYYDENNFSEKLAFIYSYPQWMVKLFVSQYGEEIGEKILEGLNKRPSVTLRVNSTKTDYEQVADELIKNGYNVEEGVICPEAIRIVKGSSVEDNPLFREGILTVQDESAMLVAPAMDLEEGMTILDLCSAPGGKTTHIAELMNNTGKVYGFDIYEHKLQLIKNNCDRLGLNTIELGILDATERSEKLKESGDRVLIDVPCSGLGIIRKKPEIKYTKREKELKEIVAIQRKIMENAAGYVKKGGILLYSTCTINKDENENNIQWFLKKFQGFQVEPLNFGKVENVIYDEKGCATVLPNEYMDGFFIAKLKRK
ncbi:16S rRNA (cytosine(967)-C(5))-methyltransferase RsmB [Clostridium culturomicium]|uniref:16S rRNA (cytosine(967)-C(5))-methyltransferase RsmB n=1 Tax=Clostridium culturomicium TaxID=1499683 RepID=UPI00058DBEFA|nr:16S rRNA (cytosine(967)-C(5))-methyltransferase RsmB [Clostridium culturomicium]